MLQSETVERLDRAWAARLGCAADVLRGKGGTVVCGHGEPLAGYLGIEVLQRLGTSVVSAPPALVPELARTLGGQDPAGALDPRVLAAALGERVHRVKDPVDIRAVDAAGYRPVSGRTVRNLRPKDWPAVLRFASSCPPDEWEEVGFQYDQEGLFGVFAGPELPTLGRATRFAEGIVSISVITRSAERGKGYAKAVVAALTERAFSQDFVPVLRMRKANVVAGRMSSALGYVSYADQVMVQLR